MFSIFNQIYYIVVVPIANNSQVFFEFSIIFVQNLKRTRIYNFLTEIQIDLFEYTGLNFLKIRFLLSDRVPEMDF